jgi:hypothetical protein
MLKRLGALLLSLLYLVTVMGFALNLHFCGSYLASVKIDAPVKSCGMLSARQMKCCSNKHFEVKVKDAHQSQWQSFHAKTFVFKMPALYLSDFLLDPDKFVTEKQLERGPPDPPFRKINTFLKNQVFRI